MRHLMLRHLRFATISCGEPQGATYGPKIAGDLARRYGYVYGVDWIDFGYQIPNIEFLQDLLLAIFPASSRSITRKINRSPASRSCMGLKRSMISGAALGKYRLRQRVRLDAVRAAVKQPPFENRLWSARASWSRTPYPYLDSKQLIGMMPGLKGAADYEKLVDDVGDEGTQSRAHRAPEHPDGRSPTSSLFRARRASLMFVQSAAHIVIVLFILLGNLGLLLSRRRPAKAARKEEA